MADAIRLSSCNSLQRSASLLTSLNNWHPIHLPFRNSSKFVDSGFVSLASSLSFKSRKQVSSLKVHALVAEATDQPKWWEKNAGPNMVDIHSTEEFLSALKEAGDKLVVVEFFGTWCASCRALFPRLCRMAEDHPEILFLKVNFDANKAMCKNLNVKFQKIKDAIEMHNPPQDENATKMGKDLNLDQAVNNNDNSANSNNT